jgi:hypothetical protein
MSIKIEDIRFSASSIDAFFAPPATSRLAAVSTSNVATRIRIGSLRDLAGFSHIAEDTLVHLSQQDFWHIGKDNDGYFIERLVDDTDGPVAG